MTVPRTSVILPTYNQIQFLSKAVESVLAQRLTDYELIIVDDGSTDGTREFLDGLEEPRIRVIHQKNMRLPGALNTGFQNARGEYLSWISSDNYCAPYFLEALVGALDAQPQAGLAYGDFFLVDTNGNILDRISVPDYGYRSLLIRNDGNAAFLYRRECMEKIGLYDTELEGAEDWDYWIRIAEHYDFVHVPDSLYYYRLHDRSMQSTMRSQVNDAVCKTIEKALNRKNKEIKLFELYPSLPECRDSEEAIFSACFDFGTKLLRARARIYALSISFLEKAVSLKPESIPARVNLSIAFAYDSQWEKAGKCLRGINETDNFEFNQKIQKILDVIQCRSHVRLNDITFFTMNKKTTELFKKERDSRLVYSFTSNQKNTDKFFLSS